MMSGPAGSSTALERMEDLVSLCARRGFIFPASEIYGGINGFWDYGPLGVELKNNLKALWWQRVVRERDDVEGLDSSIICHPRTWEASGHVEHFSDPMVDCRACKKRFRADQLDEAGACPAREGSSEHDFTDPRHFNLMLQTRIGASEDAASLAYLRAETCQPIFTGFKRVREAARQKLPFGVAQIGKAFRNEINPRNFTFRSREFEQAELEFFCHPSEREKWFAHWLEERLAFHRGLGFDAERLRTRPHADDELAHYARQAVDLEYRFPFGWQEIEGIHDRGDWDLARHGEYAGKDLGVTDEGALRSHGDRDLRGGGSDLSRGALRCLGGRRAGRGREPDPVAAAPRPGADQGGGAPALEEAGRARPGAPQAPPPALERLLRRRRQHREALPTPGRGGHPLLRDLRLRFTGGREGHGARARLHGPAAGGPRCRSRLPGRAGGASRVIRAALAISVLAALGCSGSGGHIPAPPQGAVAVQPATALSFHERADAFYQSLIRRRFNALETFNDPFLRQHFRSVDLFFDYYADLAESLDEANFEKSRPTSVAVEEFVFETPSTVRVQIRFGGDDDRPLRPTSTSVVRLDRWEREQEAWWITPGKL
jgi:hypothetical protein